MTTRIFALLIAAGLTQAAPAQNATLITTFTNPAPMPNAVFGYSLASLGSDRVLIGAWGANAGASYSGEAYLFSTNGSLLISLTNPTPAAYDFFGFAVMTVGTDQILVGAYGDDAGALDAGAAYLFNTNGVLLSTFSKSMPVAGDFLGNSLAALGADRVLVGAIGDDTGAVDAGAAYLFNRNGMLLTTITNPAPEVGDRFGASVATVGGDYLLIGAREDDAAAVDAGAVYLYSTNGTLITTITNPTPAIGDRFGYSVAAVGSDRMIVGAPRDDRGALDAGAAYLFSTNGTLLTTITNPSPAAGDIFGFRAAAVGDNMILSGAGLDDTNGENSGVAYLFSTSGVMLGTIANPTPANDDYFGASVAAIGSNLLLVGAYADDTGAKDAGVAYLFSLPPPTLSIAPATPSNASISWTPNTPGFVLQETESLSPANWTNSLSGAANPIIAPTTPPAKFFRLRQP